MESVYNYFCTIRLLSLEFELDSVRVTSPSYPHYERPTPLKMDSGLQSLALEPITIGQHVANELMQCHMLV